MIRFVSRKHNKYVHPITRLDGGGGAMSDLHEALTDGTRRDTDFAVMIASCAVRVKLLEESYYTLIQSHTLSCLLRAGTQSSFTTVSPYSL